MELKCASRDWVDIFERVMGNSVLPGIQKVIPCHGNHNIEFCTPLKSRYRHRALNKWIVRIKALADLLLSRISLWYHSE
jgi:hypothetical protein